MSHPDRHTKSDTKNRGDTMNKIKAKILQDQSAESPREWENLGHMACWHPRHRLGDIQPTEDPEQYVEGLDDPVILPLYLYDHGELTIRTEGFSCPWDSGQVGIIYVSRMELVNEYGDDSEASREKAAAVLRAEVKAYDQWLRGDVWGFVLEKEAEPCGECGRDNEPEHVDSCWGFYGGDDADTLAAMQEHVDDEHHAALAEAWERRFE